MTVCTNRVRDYSLFVHRWVTFWPLAELLPLCIRRWAQVALLKWTRKQENWDCITQEVTELTHINQTEDAHTSFIQNILAYTKFQSHIPNDENMFKLFYCHLSSSSFYNFLSESCLLCIHDTTVPQRLWLVVSFSRLCLGVSWLLHVFAWLQCCLFVTVINCDETEELLMHVICDGWTQLWSYVKLLVCAIFVLVNGAIPMGKTAQLFWLKRLAGEVNARRPVVLWQMWTDGTTAADEIPHMCWHGEITHFSRLCAEPRGLLLICCTLFLKGQMSTITTYDSETRCTIAACTCHSHPARIK